MMEREHGNAYGESGAVDAEVDGASENCGDEVGSESNARRMKKLENRLVTVGVQ